MTQVAPLLQVEEVFHPLLLAAGRETIADAPLGWIDAGLVVRIARGRKSRTRAALFDEFAAALQFPLYFGENADAFDECLSELESLPRRAGFVILITEPEQVLVDDDSTTMSWFVSSLRRAGQEWGQPIDLGEWWDRPAVPFHVVLACKPEAVDGVAHRWEEAGAGPILFPS
jgi:hypothetical protein